ncbi:Xaa-Pro aminopeptidase [Salinihabitans flavidus]|uniref:Xaa-Pro aminopeptidase n=1 Tax=Salinihabitans flavidus TaxID=569882 RepID=A0A1H8NXD2_9RHOB|nr:aminopeptidase P family protein [Salinihabitans flavidus]SEO34222.1 Xaa-Pro aminopeptidase [Salinihabitans flavidus]
MLQEFDATSRPEQGPPRLAALREAMARAGLDGYLVPRADAYQGEYVAPRDDRLAWLTGFTGSAGFCVVLRDLAGVFVDGRYRVQVKDQVDTGHFTPVDWPETRPGPWLREHLARGRIGFDPWLHTVGEIDKLTAALEGAGITLVPAGNLVDAIWTDQPGPPMAPVRAHPDDLAGASHADKRANLAETLRAAGQRAAVITLPDSLCWLLNIRGGDIPRNPVAHGFAVLHDDGRVDLFMAGDKLGGLDDHLGPEVRPQPPERFLAALAGLSGPVRLDRDSAPVAVAEALRTAEVEITWGGDPCALPKARKTGAEITATREAHLRDGAAVCAFLHWFDEWAGTGITEIDVVTELENCRRATGALLDISFDTIAGSGPHGAVIHYRVTHDTDRTLTEGDLLVLDSGGQYRDGTTDITRTLPVGTPGEAERAAFTRVLKGMIAVSRLRWPQGLAGQHLESIGRVPLWQAGQDFDHGLGHGVGAYLCVHEGPQRLSRLSDVPLEPGMILSNEPGYYREGAFGIRIENLVVVEEAPPLPGGDAHRAMLRFSTLTYAPIDRRLIVAEMLTGEERAWIDAYHATCREKIGPRLDKAAQLWLDRATAPL